MSKSKNNIILFEPWHLGDAIIAAKFANHLSNKKYQVELACNSKYHKLISAIYPSVNLFEVNLNYTTKNERWPVLSNLSEIDSKNTIVYSQRGDLRDYLVAKKMLPEAKLQFSGWYEFLAGRSAILDLPFRLLNKRVKSRYQMWEELLDIQDPVPKGKLKRNGKRICIHVGAGWKNRIYPWYKDLQNALIDNAFEVQIICSSNEEKDLFDDALLLRDHVLVSYLKEHCDLLITNDSAPMHIGSALNMPTVSIFGNTGVIEWCPRNVVPIYNKVWKGYKYHYPYQVDRMDFSKTRWPSVSNIMKTIISI